MTKANGNGDSPESSPVGSPAKEADTSHDPYYAPIVSLPVVEVQSGEDEEEPLFKMRAKLYRFDAGVEPPEWKERGTGDVKLLEHKDRRHIRLLMRRDKTLKVCANHFVRPWMILKPMKGSEKAFLWQVHADFADEDMKAEVFAIRFSCPENASKFKAAFDDAVAKSTEVEAVQIRLEEEAKSNEKEVAEDLEKLEIAKG